MSRTTPSPLSDVRAAIRQWRWPPEFRIRATAWPGDALAALTDLAAAGTDTVDADTIDADTVAAAARRGLPEGAVAEVATSVWRLRSRMAGSAEAPRSITRHLERAWDVLAEAGVEIQDHLHDPFDAGLSLKVVAVQPTPGLRRDQVIETIRPSVYVHGQVVQIGEVIVGTPDHAVGSVPEKEAKEPRP